MSAAPTAGDQPKLSNSKEERKLRKPLIERKRRERINSCLEQLKKTVTRVFQLDQSKLEKADILEMTVRHLQNIQSSRASGDPPRSVDAQQSFSTGYIQCMNELYNLILSCDWIDKALGARLLHQLLKSLPRSSVEARRAEHEACLLTPDCEEGPGRTPDHQPALHNECDNVQTSAHTPSDAVYTQTYSPFIGSLHMWRPW
ncbi:hypothetical protein FKM82_003891 [Ascaphus truei]